jgi:hypothetical protein
VIENSRPLTTEDTEEHRGKPNRKSLTTKDTKEHKGIAEIAVIARERRDRKTSTLINADTRGWSQIKETSKKSRTGRDIAGQ